MSVNRVKLKGLLKSKWNIPFVKTTEEFSGSEGGLWLSAEDCVDMSDGFPMFDYYTMNYNRYEIGVHTGFESWLSTRGWYAEWYDAGTIMLYEI
jgi:hypothetical protein